MYIYIYMYIYIPMHIYIYIEKYVERERERDTSIYIYICKQEYIYIYIYRERERDSHLHKAQIRCSFKPALTCSVRWHDAPDLDSGRLALGNRSGALPKCRKEPVRFDSFRLRTFQKLIGSVRFGSEN